VRLCNPIGCNAPGVHSKSNDSSESRRVIIGSNLDTVAKATHVQNDLVELQSFRLLTSKDKKIDSLTFIFLENDTNGRAKAYQVEINSTGKLDWHSYKSEFPATMHPIEIFTEIDKFNLASLKTGEGGLELQVDFNFSNTGYGSDFMNLYELENGNLLPLKEIVFRGTPVCVISVFQLQKNQSGSNRGYRNPRRNTYNTDLVSQRGHE